MNELLGEQMEQVQGSGQKNKGSGRSPEREPSGGGGGKVQAWNKTGSRGGEGRQQRREEEFPEEVSCSFSGMV